MKRDEPQWPAAFVDDVSAHGSVAARPVEAVSKRDSWAQGVTSHCGPQAAPAQRLVSAAPAQTGPRSEPSAARGSLGRPSRLSPSRACRTGDLPVAEGGAILDLSPPIRDDDPVEERARRARRLLRRCAETYCCLEASSRPIARDEWPSAHSSRARSVSPHHRVHHRHSPGSQSSGSDVQVVRRSAEAPI